MKRLVFLIAMAGGCVSELQQQTLDAYRNCLVTHPDGIGCESIAQQYNMLENQRRARAQAVANAFDTPPPPRPVQTTCRRNYLGGVDCTSY